MRPFARSWLVAGMPVTLALLLFLAPAGTGADAAAAPAPANAPAQAPANPQPSGAVAAAPANLAGAGPIAPAPAPAVGAHVIIGPPVPLPANAANHAGDNEDGDGPPTPPAPVMQALPEGWSASPTNVDTVVPGREPPATAAHEGVVRVAWNNLHTLIVVGPGHGVLRPGFVLTYQDSGDLQVAYRAAIFRDRHGVLHADARGAVIVGPSAASWSPDSFAIFGSGLVVTLDDHGSSERGMVTRTLAQGEKDYLPMLLLAESIVDDGI